MYVDTIIESAFGVEEDEAKSSTTKTKSQGTDDPKETLLDVERPHEAEILLNMFASLANLRRTYRYGKYDACNGRLVSALKNRSDLRKLSSD